MLSKQVLVRHLVAVVGVMADKDVEGILSVLEPACDAVVCVPIDSPRALANFARKQSLPFPLLSDPEHRVMEEWGAWGEKKNYGRTYTGVIRSTVVVDSDGTVRLARYNVRATGHVARLRKELGID